MNTGQQRLFVNTDRIIYVSEHTTVLGPLIVRGLVVHIPVLQSVNTEQHRSVNIGGPSSKDV